MAQTKTSYEPATVYRIKPGSFEDGVDQLLGLYGQVGRPIQTLGARKDSYIKVQKIDRTDLIRLGIPIREFPVFDPETVKLIASAEPRLCDKITATFAVNDTEFTVNYGKPYGYARLIFSRLLGVYMDTDNHELKDYYAMCGSLGEVALLLRNAALSHIKGLCLKPQTEEEIVKASGRLSEIESEMLGIVRREAEQRGIRVEKTSICKKKGWFGYPCQQVGYTDVNIEGTVICSTPRNYGWFTVEAEWQRNPQELNLEATSSKKEEYLPLIKSLGISHNRVGVEVDPRRFSMGDKNKDLERVVEALCDGTLGDIFVQEEWIVQPTEK